MEWFPKVIMGLIGFIVLLTVLEQALAAIPKWVWVVGAIAVIVIVVIKFRGGGRGHGGGMTHHHYYHR